MIGGWLVFGFCCSSLCLALQARRRLASRVVRLVEYFPETAPVLGPPLTHPKFCFEEFARRHPKSSLVVLRQELTQRLTQEQRCGNIGAGPVGPMAILLISLGHTIAVFERLGAHKRSFPGSVIPGALRTQGG